MSAAGVGMAVVVVAVVMTMVIVIMGMARATGKMMMCAAHNPLLRPQRCTNAAQQQESTLGMGAIWQSSCHPSLWS